jgi:5'-3' exonuclease
MLDRKKEEEEEDIFKTEEREAEEVKRKEEEARNEFRRKLAEKEHEITMKAKIFGTKGKKPVGEFPTKKMQQSPSAPVVKAPLTKTKSSDNQSLNRPGSSAASAKSTQRRHSMVPGLPSAAKTTVNNPPIPKSTSTEKLPNLVKSPSKKAVVT